MKRGSPPSETPIVGRPQIAEALSEIMGEPVNAKKVDRLSLRLRHALPIHGYGYKPKAYLSELRAWWDSCERRPRQIGRAR